MAHHSELCKDVKFVDIDFEELMNSKRQVILSTPQMKDMLDFYPYPRRESGIMLDSVQYGAVGCDLRNIRRLDRLLKLVTDPENCLILCIAEVSITYMGTEDADAVIRWASKLCPGKYRCHCRRKC
jgi:tRNA wybutosine-synthesizing protein 4